MSESTQKAIVDKSNELLTLLQSKFGPHLKEAKVDLGDAVIRISASEVGEFFNLLKMDASLRFNLLVDITAVDWMDTRDERFEVIYHVYSVSNRFRLRVKVDVLESKPEIKSIVSLWAGANFLEREVWDMYGINFIGHPDQRRILMYDEFDGHPLRKDYPVQGKQPRIPFRHPEVRNTALDMSRPALVQINKKKNEARRNREAHL